MTKTPRIATAIALAFTLTSCGIGPFAAAAPAESFCNGMSSTLGGCDPNLPRFSGTTCDALATQFGSYTDQRLVAILNGAEDGGENARSVQIQHAVAIAATLLFDRMNELGILESCADAGFIAKATGQFGDDVRSRIGAWIYDGSPVATYQEFLEIIARTLGPLGAEPS